MSSSTRSRAEDFDFDSEYSRFCGLSTVSVVHYMTITVPQIGLLIMLDRSIDSSHLTELGALAKHPVQ